MAPYYLMNLAGCHLTDQQYADIRFPRLELVTHVTTKCLQAGVIVGACIIGPLVAIKRGKRDRESIAEASFHYGKKGAVIGAVTGPLMVFARLVVSTNPDYAYDCSYRIRHNSQMFVDRMSLYGVTIGVGVAYYKKEPLLKGALFGFMGGCIVGGVLNALF